MTEKQQFAEAKILDSNNTYLIEGSILPVYLDADGNLYLVEEYEKGCPCGHFIKDLYEDGVMVAINPIGYSKTKQKVISDTIIYFNRELKDEEIN